MSGPTNRGRSNRSLPLTGISSWPSPRRRGNHQAISDTIPSQELAQSSLPANCTYTASTNPLSGVPAKMYRLKSSVATTPCAETSPQAAIIITALRSFGIILAYNGISDGLIGTPDFRRNDAYPAYPSQLHPSDFEPVNVSNLMQCTSSGQAQ